MVSGRAKILMLSSVTAGTMVSNHYSKFPNTTWGVYRMDTPEMITLAVQVPILEIGSLRILLCAALSLLPQEMNLNNKIRNRPCRE